MTKYQFNPHRHVKIWLSQNPSVFLNMTNQLRLIRMRLMNPLDDIHLVYDSRLLNDVAISELNQFCEKHHIIPVDVVSEVIPGCVTPLEIRILELYHEEILNLGEGGGNLAGASDKLRVLSPIYRRGAYTDFDVEVDTLDLPEFIEVNAPILVRISSYFPNQSSRDERISVNNEFFAVVHEEDAKSKINLIQQIGIELFGIQKLNQKNPSPYQDAEGVTGALLRKLSLEQNARQIRRSIMRLSRSNELFYRTLNYLDNLQVSSERLFFKNAPQVTSQLLEHSAQELELLFHLKIWKPSISSTAVVKNKEFFLDLNREELLNDMLMWTVIETTGPSAFCLGLFLKNFFSAKEMQEMVNPVAMGTYGLERYFKSTNGYPMHVDAKMKELCEKNASNDRSWQFFGMSKMRHQEVQMQEAAKKIQGWWRR